MDKWEVIINPAPEDDALVWLSELIARFKEMGLVFVLNQDTGYGIIVGVNDDESKKQAEIVCNALNFIES